VIRREAELGKWWTEKAWVSRSGLFGVEVAFEDAKFTAVACPQHGGGLAEVDGVHNLLNTEPVVSFRLRDGAARWLRGWAMALRDEAVKKKAVEKARRVKHCRI